MSNTSDEVEEALKSFSDSDADKKELVINNSLQELENLVNEHCCLERIAKLRPILDCLRENKMTPASTSAAYHGAFPGGLICHVLDVATIALETALDFQTNSSVSDLVSSKIVLYSNEMLERSRNRYLATRESIVTAAILHDLNKVMDPNGNKMYEENLLKDGKRSDKKPFAKSNNYDPFGNLTIRSPESIIIKHGGAQYSSGAVSLAVAEQLSPGIIYDLTEDEIQAIVFHAGLYEKCSKEGFVGKESMLSILIHYSDMVASRFFT